MESVESHLDSYEEYNPDNRASIHFDKSDRICSNDPRTSTATSRISVSTISKLKGVHWKIRRRRTVRSWLVKGKFTFPRNQAPNCWDRAPSSHDQHVTNIVPRVVSVARSYYHANKGLAESPLEYLYRLNVADLVVKLQVMDRPIATQSEHLEHIIDTLSNREFVDPLVLLRKTDVD
ncbi:hypothetical protein PHMEG_00014081 [Phytophthora megakarya]|uniref:Uncharacterized protein n=1 Tax=Phytophthora megakarya TaxID=4795 RepID=A0A225W6W3_9STRA|nr:hypothetical protein PHMEG_00014081 [Phytophthora megakarya]